MSQWLALDTASARACVAVVDLAKRQVLSERGLDVPRRHAESMAGAVQGALTDAGLAFSDLEGFAAGVGPGSFVGVRVALSTAKGFALARQRPLVGFCSLLALAGHRDAPDGAGLAVIDARRGEVYARAFTRTGTELTAGAPPQPVAPERAVELGVDAGVWIGSGAALCVAVAATPPAVVVDASGPDGAGLLAALCHSTAGGIVDEATTLAPNYCRAPDAKKPGEIKR